MNNSRLLWFSVAGYLISLDVPREGTRSKNEEPQTIASTAVCVGAYYVVRCFIITAQCWVHIYVLLSAVSAGVKQEG